MKKNSRSLFLYLGSTVLSRKDWVGITLLCQILPPTRFQSILGDITMVLGK